ncbi:putative response regulatory protein VV2_1193 [Fibrisoma limi BUZ 3]|uniref:Putative response regulatory protein VV2_1193 n=1 Tax=Fibrisoma limi BUZ 3 TaxID=1185876 RepID=I2GIX4_9BACT|nr:LytTR family DNA-binding domain-containing protein [Fibrisoma limi]CCH53849.1 putative response regulatory protein VV2_1193 [Fibrisoma limi BUZ 3]
MNALIIEDEIPAARRLTRLLQDVDDTIEVTGIVDSISQAVERLGRETNLDVIFSDIHLSDGLSFEVFRQVEPPCPIIFTTAYDEYAIQAFKLNSIDYLLKPIVADELEQALLKFRKGRSGRGGMPVTLPNIEQLISTLNQHQSSFRQRFLVSYKDSFLPIVANEVAYFYSENKVTRLVRLDGKWFPLPETLEELAEQLDPKHFFRANRQFILNLHSIQAIHKHFNGKLKLVLAPEPAEEVMVSRERAEEFKAWLNQ